MYKVVAVVVVAGVSALGVRAQAPASESQLDPSHWGVVYDVPETEDVALEADVPYLKDARGSLAIDVYRPPDAKRGEKRPAVVFLNAIGDAPASAPPAPANKLKSWGIYRTWPRLVAAHGLVGVSMECDGTRIQESLAALFDFLEKHGAEHGIDGARLGVYAASANVSGASEYLLGGHASAGIRAAVLYYGQPPARAPRRDLPVLFVVAESDVPRLGPDLGGLWQRVVEARAPWTLLFGSGMPHAFDALRDRDDARRIVQQTIAFWRSHLEPVPAPPWDPSPAREIVAALYSNDTDRAAVMLKQWVADHPDDGQAQLQYGRVLAETGRFQECGVAYERAFALGVRDPSLDVGLGLVRAGQQRWREAEELLARGVAAGAVDGRVLAGLGHAQLMLGKVDAGVQSYERALAAGIPAGAQTRGLACFNLACGYARLGKKDQAFEKLGTAVDEGFNEKKIFEDDADLAPLKSDPRYQPLQARLVAR
jgi:tetratricopeptide (TPR) repeat protein